MISIDGVAFQLLVSIYKIPRRISFASVESEALEKGDVSASFDEIYGSSIYNIKSYVPAFLF